ncbi:cation transporter [Arthrobacter sp. GCM10027362]|uniref:cation transporter n=1 Tax=Arthrobacter sp. GCM10027362 TaxID=3273379 RepID=UPI00364556EB
MNTRFGRTELPEKQERILKKAVRLQWTTTGVLAVAVTLVFLAMGNSQAMKAAWIEDMLSFAPPLAFLLAVRIVNRPPTPGYPYGFHRATGVAHLVAAVALCVMGAFLLIDSGLGLLKAEHPPIGAVQVFGQTVWLGWLMIAVMAVTAVPPVFLGRAKMKLAKELHSKVLYADADMNKADWMTAAGSIVGVAGIGVGLWWADAAAALFIAAGILRDGYKNMRAAVTDLMDTRAMTFDDGRPHPLIRQVDDYLRGLSWVQEAGSRVRDQGHVFHVEAFVVPRDGQLPPLEVLERARDECIDLDWKLQDMVLVPVSELPVEAGGSRQHQSERNR